jgi:hypothetical protein
MQSVQPMAKKPKYIIKDENERSKNNQTPLPFQARKNIMSNEGNHHPEPLKSVNAARRQDMQRNKSVVCREKHNIVNSTSWLHNKNIEAPLHSERNSFNQIHQSNSQVNHRDLKDINIQIQKQVSKVRQPELSEWEQALSKFKKWTPSSHNFVEMSQLFEEMVGLMMKEEL